MCTNTCWSTSQRLSVRCADRPPTTHRHIGAGVVGPGLFEGIESPADQAGSRAIGSPGVTRLSTRVELGRLVRGAASGPAEASPISPHSCRDGWGRVATRVDGRTQAGTITSGQAFTADGLEGFPERELGLLDRSRQSGGQSPRPTCAVPVSAASGDERSGRPSPGDRS